MIHAIGEEGKAKEDHRISEFWGGHPRYHQIQAQEGELRETYEKAFQIVMQHLGQSREQAEA